MNFKWELELVFFFFFEEVIFKVWEKNCGLNI